MALSRILRRAGADLALLGLTTPRDRQIRAAIRRWRNDANFLLIGDESLGRQLLRPIRAWKPIDATIARATASTFLARRRAERIVRAANPDLVVVSLGASDGSRQEHSFGPTYEHLVKRLSACPLLLVLPPATDDEALKRNAVISDVAVRCSAPTAGPFEPILGEASATTGSELTDLERAIEDRLMTIVHGDHWRDR